MEQGGIIFSLQTRSQELAYVETVQTTVDTTPIAFSPGSLRPWIPNCPSKFRPRVGMRFNTLEEGVRFYETYARECGFSTRLYSTKKTNDGRISHRYVVCNREGYKEDSLKKEEKMIKKAEKFLNTGKGLEMSVPIEKKAETSTRINVETRVGCKARIVFTLSSDGGYIVFRFHDAHNHQLVTPESKKFLKLNRNLTIVHKHIIASNARVNQGPMKSFRMFNEQVSGYDNIGASLIDFKNFHRDMKKYIGESDAQMLISILHRKSECNSSFFFDYDLNEDDHLIRVFWADPICIKNYVIFGDIISFDTTYDTNKYSMVFAPFTGVDHHAECVTFGAGFIAKEDIPSFT